MIVEVAKSLGMKDFVFGQPTVTVKTEVGRAITTKGEKYVFVTMQSEGYMIACGAAPTLNEAVKQASEMLEDVKAVIEECINTCDSGKIQLNESSASDAIH